MKQILILVGVLLIVILGYLLVTGAMRPSVDTTDETPVETQTTFESAEYGFSFSYPSGDTGYTLASTNEVSGDLVFIRSLFHTKEYQEFLGSTDVREAPPAIVVAVYRSPMSLSAKEWVEEAGSALDAASPQEKEIGGAMYVMYTHDGLYASDVYVYAQEGYVYTISAQYQDEESNTRTDVVAFLETMSWSEPTLPAQVAHGDIVVTSPEVNARIDTPLAISGKARGTWFFEASFPIILTDWDGKIIAEGHATADGDWMTEDLVGFSAEIEFEKPEFGERGTLILKKDNPSGLPEHDDAIEIPIRFKN